MIKVFNKKPIGEINKLREQGLYNAPFSVQESANSIKIETPDTKELKEKVADLEEKLARYKKTIDELNDDLDVLVGGSDE